MTHCTSSCADCAYPHPQDLPRIQYVDAFICTDGDVLGLRFLERDSVELSYVNDPSRGSFVVDIDDLQRLADALAETADFIREDDK